MVSGEGAAAQYLTHGSMRRDSIGFILRRLGLSHYIKTQVDEKVAAASADSKSEMTDAVALASASFAAGVPPTVVSATYQTKVEAEIMKASLKSTISEVERAISEIEQAPGAKGWRSRQGWRSR